MFEDDVSGRNFDRSSGAAPNATGGPGSAEESVLAGRLSHQQRDTAEGQEAELERYKTRFRKEVEDQALKTREEILSDFLEVADNLERAIASWKEGDNKDVQSVKDGVDLVLRLFRSKLERYAVTTIEAKGKPFDPHLHHAVSQLATGETAPGTVFHEVQKGYWMGERLLRPAIVVVASAPSTSSEGSDADEASSMGGDSASAWHGYQHTRR
jgi:molecular chaperone GrpE